MKYGKCEKTKLFYFADPHSFSYPFYVRFLFKMRGGHIVSRINNSEWNEEKNYIYYGEPVNCIVPKATLEYKYVISLLNSDSADNVFGAINYLLRNYRQAFIADINSGKICSSKRDILFQYFSTDIK